MLDLNEAKRLLEEDRRNYLKKTKEYLEIWLNKGLDDAAAQVVITSGEELQKLTGTLLFLEQCKQFPDEYPRFNTIFGY